MPRPSLDSLKTRRNFEGRIHPLTRPNWLASPPLVVAYALTGTTRIDLEREPLGTGSDGRPVFLREIWPTVGGNDFRSLPPRHPDRSRLLPKWWNFRGCAASTARRLMFEEGVDLRGRRP